MPKLRHTLAFNVASLRKARGLTQDELSEKAAMAKRTFQDLEYENSWPSDTNIESIARALGVSPLTLFQRAKSREHIQSIEILEELEPGQLRAVLGVLESMLNLNSLKGRPKKANSD